MYTSKACLKTFLFILPAPSEALISGVETLKPSLPVTAGLEDTVTAIWD